MEGRIMTMKEWSVCDRPRERLKKVGAENLSDSELLAIIIRTGFKGRNKSSSAVDVARELLASHDNSLAEIALQTPETLAATMGMGITKAVTLKAAFELGRRFMSESLHEHRSVIQNSSDAFRLLAARLRNLSHEECWAIFLNRANKVLAIERMSTGGNSATVVDRKMILKTAVSKLASGIILAHNHPSGNRFPGECDIKETRLLKDAAKMLDITLLDHIIIAGDGYYSFADNA